MWLCDCADTYDVFFSRTNPPTTQAAYSIGNTTVSNNYLGTLNYQTTYFWFVRAKNTLGNTDGPVWSFTTAVLVAPTTPSFPFPADGAQDVSRNTSASWAACSNADSYEVYFGPDRYNMNYITQTTDTTLNNGTFGTLHFNTSYFWQIKAEGTQTNTWGPVWSFRTLSVPLPGAMTNPTPANGSGNASISTTLAWGASTNAERYLIYLSTSNPPTTYLAATFTNSADHTAVGTLAYGTVYYWQVIATNLSGNTSSAIWSFTTASAVIPEAPTVPYPTNGDNTRPRTTYLSWKNCFMAETYDVYIGTGTPAFVGSTNTNSITNAQIGGPLQYSTSYYWYVIAKNAAGQAQSATWNFKTSVYDPAPTPRDPSPADGETGVPITTGIEWSSLANTGYYYIYFGKFNPPPYITSHMGFFGFPPTNYCYNSEIGGPLEPDTTYYWYIIARHYQGGDSTSPLWSFKTASGGPDNRWTEKTSTANPSARVHYALAWDCSSIILFGGGKVTTWNADYVYVLPEAETWSWNGSDWTKISPASQPSARYGSAMCWTPQGAILYGGFGVNEFANGTDYLSDTWKILNGVWTKLEPVFSPPPRRYGYMDYDRSRGVVVLFGGENDTSYLSDTWEYNPATNAWIERYPASPPPERARASTFYAAGGVAVFGGWWGYGGPTGTYIWTGASWQNSSVTTYPKQVVSNTAFASSLDETYGIFYGGGYGWYEDPIDELWQWDGSAWARLAMTAPPGDRRMARFAYDPVRKEFVLFGGYNDTRGEMMKDTWTFKK
jgi:hypothetical protein